MRVPRRIQGAAACEDCRCDPATCRVQGVTHYYGDESWRLCDRCAEQVRGPRRCDWCKKDADELRPTHDWEELCGLAPRVYWVCLECLRREGESRDEVLAELNAHYGEEL